jgi:hypothetical protein
MGAFDDVLQQLARRRSELDRRAAALSEWRQLHRDVFAALLHASETLAQQQRAFLDALARGRPASRGHTAYTLQACRALRSILREVDAMMLALLAR